MRPRHPEISPYVFVWTLYQIAAAIGVLCSAFAEGWRSIPYNAMLFNGAGGSLLVVVLFLAYGSDIKRYNAEMLEWERMRRASKECS